MRINSTYSVKIKNYNRILDPTVRIYRNVVDYFIDVILKEWTVFSGCHTSKSAVYLAERYCVRTARNPKPPYDFTDRFYKFPSYLRRSALAEAYGKVCSYQSNIQNWQKADPRTRGAEPSSPKAGFVYPAMYRDNCYFRIDNYTAKIKVYIRNTWDWLTVQLRKSDVDYIMHHCANRKECVPTLQKRGRQWYLDFVLTSEQELHKTDIFDQTIVSVDLGINSACVCSVMRSDGTIIGRHFLRLPKEYDSLERKISRIKHAQRHGSRRTPALWSLADGVNDDIAVKTAKFIIDTAVSYSADTIVMEHLDLAGRKRGSKKQRLHLWKARRVQAIVTDRAHSFGMRVSTVNAWGTSRLAFDGSGKILRGRESERTGNTYSLCEFQTGKIYNCDLNASYNIGARYFVREIIKSLPVMEGRRIAANVPGCAKRSTCTLSTLISLNGELCAVA